MSGSLKFGTFYGFIPIIKQNGIDIEEKIDYI